MTATDPSGIQIVQEARRLYVVGNTYPHRNVLKAIGCKWDAASQRWWVGSGKRAELEALVGQLAGKDQQYRETKASGILVAIPLKCEAGRSVAKDAGCVWDKDRKQWRCPTEDAANTVREYVAKWQAKVDAAAAAAKAAEAARKAANQKTPEQVLASVGRTLRAGGKPTSYDRYLGHGRKAEVQGDMPRVGELITRKDGPWAVVSVGELVLMTQDDLDDMDDFSRKSGWYVSYTAVPVVETAEETAAAAAKAAAEAARKAVAARRNEIERTVRSIDNHDQNTDTAGLACLWGNFRTAGSEALYGDATRLVYVTSSYDDGPRAWGLADATLAREALSLAVTSGLDRTAREAARLLLLTVPESAETARMLLQTVADGDAGSQGVAADALEDAGMADESAMLRRARQR